MGGARAAAEGRAGSGRGVAAGRGGAWLGYYARSLENVGTSGLGLIAVARGASVCNADCGSVGVSSVSPLPPVLTLGDVGPYALEGDCVGK